MVNTVSSPIIVPIVQMRKLRQAEAMELGQGYIARNGGTGLEFTPKSFDSMVFLLVPVRGTSSVRNQIK